MQLTRDDLLSLEQYSAERNAMRQQVMAHKKNRRLAIGEHLSLYFEDKLTMRLCSKPSVQSPSLKKSYIAAATIWPM